jgi:hypothetical protein
MQLLWSCVLFLIVPAWMWYFGTFLKYPELALPIMLIWFAVIAPAAHIPEWHGKWRQLERYKTLAYKRNDMKLLEKIDEQIQWVRDWNTPATLGAMKMLVGKYPQNDERRMAEIEKRVAELKRVRV